MITTVGAIIVNNLSREIRDSKYFCIMSDEAADISVKKIFRWWSDFSIRPKQSQKNLWDSTFVRMEQQEQLSKI